MIKIHILMASLLALAMMLSVRWSTSPSPVSIPVSMPMTRAMGNAGRSLRMRIVERHNRFGLRGPNLCASESMHVGTQGFSKRNSRPMGLSQDGFVPRASIFGDGGAWERQNPGEKPAPVENPLDKLPDPIRSSVEVNGNTWSYLRTEGGDGSKPTIIFAHGILSSSYSFRDTLKILQQKGYDAIAFDWPGFGESSKPQPGSFGYQESDYTSNLKSFITAVGADSKPFVLATQGYILGQYGLLFACENQEMVEKLVVMNTPLGLKSKLPSPLNSYTGFMKGFAFGKNPDAGMFHAGGGPYAFAYEDYKNLQKPYESSEDARVAFETIMESLDFDGLLKKVSSSAERFKKKALIAWGVDDKYLDLNTVLNWLEYKPTSMKLFGMPASIGHFPQMDYPEQLVETITRFVEDKDVEAPSDISVPASAPAGPDF